MADKVTTDFPKLGKGGATAKNTSGRPTTKAVPKGGAVAGGVVDAMLVRGKRNVNERLGAVHTPQASYAPQEDPAASANLRNTRIVKPAKSWCDFGSGRQYGNSGLV